MLPPSDHLYDIQNNRKRVYCHLASQKSNAANQELFICIFFLILLCHSSVEGKLKRKSSNRIRSNRKPLKPANQETAVSKLKTRSRGVRSSSSKSRIEDEQHHQNGQICDGHNLLEALDECSFGVLKEKNTKVKRPQVEEEKKRNLRVTPNRNHGNEDDDGCLLQTLDQGSFRMLENHTGDESHKIDDTQDLCSNAIEPADLDAFQLSMHSPQDVTSTILNDAGQDSRKKGNVKEFANPEVPMPNLEACKVKVISRFDEKNDSRLNEPTLGQGKLSSSKTSQSCADEDPYEFIPSQRTPRKPKPKRNRHQKSGKNNKEFDYMKWRKVGGADKRLLNSQAFFNQPSTQSQVVSTTPSGVDESLQSTKDHSFKKPSEVDNRLESPTQQDTVVDSVAPSEHDPLTTDKRPGSHQRSSRNRKNRKGTSGKTMQDSEMESISNQGGYSTNSTRRTSELFTDLQVNEQNGSFPSSLQDSQITNNLPNKNEEKITSNQNIICATSETNEKLHPHITQQEKRSSNRQKKNTKEDQSILLEEPPTRRLRSRGKDQSTRKEDIEIHKIGKEFKKPININRGKVDNNCKASNESNMTEIMGYEVVDKDEEVISACEVDHIVDSDDEDGDYRFEDVSVHNESDGGSTQVSLTDPSYEPSAETSTCKASTEIFTEGNPPRKPSRRTELNLVSVPHPHEPHAHKKAPHDEDLEEDMALMGCSQPQVKKHSPLGSAGVFGQVYKRGNLRLNKSPGEKESVKLIEEGVMDVCEKVQKMYTEAVDNDFNEEEDGSNVREEVIVIDGKAGGSEDVNRQKSLIRKETVGSSKEISQDVISQPDLIDQEVSDVVHDVSVDLTIESDAEEQTSLQPHIGEQERQLSQNKECEMETIQDMGAPQGEEPRHDADNTKSDWELALELAREFDTAPRQFSLRSSRRGRIEPKATDPFVQPSRTKPELEVSVNNKRVIRVQKSDEASAEACEINEIRKDGDTSLKKQSKPHHISSEAKKHDHNITAGKKTLQQTSRSTISEGKSESAPNSRNKVRRRSIRRSATDNKLIGLDSEGGMIESFDSNVAHSIREKARPLVPSTDEPDSAVVTENPDLHQNVATDEEYRSIQGRDSRSTSRKRPSSSGNERRSTRSHKDTDRKESTPNPCEIDPLDDSFEVTTKRLDKSEQAKKTNPEKIKWKTPDRFALLEPEGSSSNGVRKSTTGLKMQQSPPESESPVRKKSESEDQRMTGSVSLFTAHDRCEVDTPECSLQEHSPQSIQWHTPELKMLEDGGCGGTESGESDRTESIDLGVENGKL